MNTNMRWAALGQIGMPLVDFVVSFGLSRYYIVQRSFDDTGPYLFLLRRPKYSIIVRFHFITSSIRAESDMEPDRSVQII